MRRWIFCVVLLAGAICESARAQSVASRTDGFRSTPLASTTVRRRSRRSLEAITAVATLVVIGTIFAILNSLDRRAGRRAAQDKQRKLNEPDSM